MLTGFRGTAVLYSKLFNAREIRVRWARLSRAITDSITKVLIGAETGDLGCTAAQALSKTKHGGDAVLL